MKVALALGDLVWSDIQGFKGISGFDNNSKSIICTEYHSAISILSDHVYGLDVNH